jgi:hypothetical protein
MCMVQRDEYWFKFQETILFKHIGEVEQVNIYISAPVTIELK